MASVETKPALVNYFATMRLLVDKVTLATKYAALGLKIKCRYMYNSAAG